uniref:Bacteriophage capsid protein n=1 Tax=uncultured marine virus TaxID=186617 RepID=A0A0F7L4G7_9VIRU|nr:bacteriophage capsid protein [uncultured marine virus]
MPHRQGDRRTQSPTPEVLSTLHGPQADLSASWCSSHLLSHWLARSKRHPRTQQCLEALPSQILSNSH